MISKNIILLFLVVLLTAQASMAQVDTIRIPNQKLDTRLLKPGMKEYLITMQDSRKEKSLFLWYWIRNISTENRKGEQVFTITQHWYGSDTLNYRSIYSINRRSDFAPLCHSETVRGKTSAYNWTEQQIRGADSVSNNSKSNFSLDFHSPNLNWNLDIETFEMLPLAAGKVFAINFYDAGLNPPQYVIYKVIGSEEINYAGRMVDCWELYTEGSTKNGKYNETYWISKRDHEFLLEKDEYGDGLYRTKVKMPVHTDLLTKFR